MRTHVHKCTYATASSNLAQSSKAHAGHVAIKHTFLARAALDMQAIYTGDQRRQSLRQPVQTTMQLHRQSRAI
jgi:hypothetical protein